MNDREREAERNAIIRESSAEHLRRYRESGGVDGASFRGAPILILTTTGRRTGERRSTPLMYGRDGADLVVVGSLGGAGTHPHWYLNLEADPAAEVELGTERFAVHARVARGDERDRLWKLMLEVYATYATYQERTDREIPVVVLEPVGQT